jgi:eukaryotic-like serine/threonine-protein kinase
VGSSRVGPYRLMRRIKQGGQADVFLGYDARLQRPVAIKVHTVPARFGASRALLREARRIALIQHPRAVQIYDVITASDYLALVMEYVPGTDLEELLKSVQPSPASVVAVATDLAGALAVARQHRVVHGDLKPANVLISTDGQAKLVDFGIARRLGVPDSSAQAGSLQALSPEQAKGEPLDVRTDLFALGCIMYHMLTGQHPYLTTDHGAPCVNFDQQPQPLEELVSPAQEIPEGLPHLIHSLLQASPGDRPANTHEVRMALRRIAMEIPAARHGSLQAEAAPLFRSESMGELPLQIPSALGRRGKSRLYRTAEQNPWSWRNPLGRWRIAATSIVALTLIGLAGFGVHDRWLRAPHHVLIDLSQVEVAGRADLPSGLSMDWLVQQVSEAVEGKIGRIYVSGPVGGTVLNTIYAPGRSPADQPLAESFSMRLRCTREFCLLGVERDMEDAPARSEQMVLLPESTLYTWQENIGRAVNRLFTG